MRRGRRDRLEIVSAAGGPSDEELAAATLAVERVIEQEREATAISLWLRAGRAQGRRLGMFDYRDRFSRDDVWRLSARMPFGGREYPGLVGRGDAR